MVFGDVSGFTRMSERLARHGKVGAEEVAGAIDACFADLLDVAYRCGGSLLKFGGDAVLLLFTGEDHAVRAAHAAVGMRRRLRTVGRIDTSAGRVVLRISMGAHSGTFHLALVGGSHRELLVVGPAVSATVAAEGEATAGEIVMTAAMADRLPGRCRGPVRPGGFLLRRPPGPDPDLPVVPADPGAVDIGSFIPVAVRTHLLGGGREPEHRTASVAFLHFDGTDEVLASAGPDGLARRLDATVRCAQEASDAQGVCFLGTDVDHDGGKILLVAGAPSRIGDDEQRLLLALRAVADSDDPDVLPMRIGVNRGGVFAGEVGPPYRRTYTTMGDTVNLAARLMARAAPGQIVATAGVLDHSAARFATEPLAPFLVKGKRRPVQAVLVGPLLRGRADGADLLALTGVDDHLATFRSALAEVAVGGSSVVEITGGLGAGKTRLARALADLAAPVPVATLLCERYEASTPFALAGALGRWLLGLPPDATPEVVRHALEAALGADGDGDPDRLPLIGTGLGLDVPDTPATALLEPEFRRALVERTTADFAARRLPDRSVLVVEDVHHMDEPSCGVIGALAASATPLLLCVTRRPDPGGLQVGEREAEEREVGADGVRRIGLAPLGLDQAVEALEAATEDAPLRPHEARALAERSRGNPLFLTELLRAWWDGAPVDALPESVDGAVTAEIDGLAPRQRRLLRTAAVLGSVFTADELAALWLDEDAPDGPAAGGGPPSAAALLADLAPFVDVDHAGLARFRSALTRDCAYEGLSYRRRRLLHGRAAAALTGRLGASVDTEAGLLSLHCMESGDVAGAWRWGRVAAGRALDRFANHEAAVLFERALAAGRRLDGVVPAELAAAWTGLGDARERAGEYPAAARAYGRARALLVGDPVAQAELCLRSAWLPERNGRPAEAVRWIRRGLALVDGRPGTEASQARARLSGWYAAVRQAQGANDEAVRWCEEAVAEARRSGDEEAEAHALFILDWARVSQGRPDLAVHSTRALEIYRRRQDLGKVAAVLRNLGGFAYYRGAWDEALDLYRQSRDACLATGNEVDAAMATMNSAEILLDQGRMEEAREAIGAARRVVRAAGYPMGIGFTAMLLGRLEARTGDGTGGLAHLDEARRTFTAAGLEADLDQVDVATVEALLLAGRSTEALAAAEEIPVHPGTAAAVLRLRGEALLQAGDLDGARDAVASARRAADEQGLGFEGLLGADAARRCAEAAGDAARAAALAGQVADGCAQMGVEALPAFPGPGGLRAGAAPRRR